MAFENSNRGSLSKVSETLEGIQDDCWSLLVLERDLTLMTAAGASFDKHEVDALKKRYTALSMKVFGQVRADRQFSVA